MEYLDGETLLSYVRHHGGRLSFEEAYVMLRPVMKSLEELHRMQILHRDISPDNIMVLRNGSNGRNVKLFDFGGAKVMTTDDTQTRSMVKLMKRGYSPLEQTAGPEHQGPWTDVYAMAATLYFCICGEAPSEVLLRLQTPESFKIPSRNGAAITPAQEKVLLKGLQVRSQDRFRSMREFSDAIEQTLYKPVPKKWPLAVGVGVGMMAAGIGLFHLGIHLHDNKNTNNEGPAVVTEKITEEVTEKPIEAVTEKPPEIITEKLTEKPTEVVTEKLPEIITEKPTEKPTEVITEKPTEVVTEKPTERPTEVVTEAPVKVVTEKPTEPPTEVPTEPPTETPTEKPTEPPTEAPTEPPTEKPTETTREPAWMSEKLSGYAGTYCIEGLHNITLYEGEPGGGNELEIYRRAAIYVDEAVLYRDEVWGHTLYCGMDGWIRLSDVYFVSQEDYSIHVGDLCYANYDYWEGLAVREAPDGKAEQVIRMPFGTVFTVDALQGGWGHLTYEGVSGWTNMNYMCSFTADQYYRVSSTNDGQIMLRTAPDDEGDPLQILENGTVVFLTTFENGWGFAYCGQDLTGWVKMCDMQLAPAQAAG